MLYQFLSLYEPNLIERCRVKTAKWSMPAETKKALISGSAVFIRELIHTLKTKRAEAIVDRRVSGPADGGRRQLSEMSKTAMIHARELLDHGFTVDQVVHALGDVGQSVTDLASELGVPFEINEFRTLNRCLDDAIAAAVREFSSQREMLLIGKEKHAMNMRLGFFAHELRNLVQTATLSYAAMKAGESGSTVAVMDRTLSALRDMVDGAVDMVRMDAGMPVHNQIFSLADLILEVKMSATLEADAYKCILNVASVDQELAVEGDRRLLSAAIGNLLQNAFKFTHAGTKVTLSAYAVDDRILIDVADHCGGLPWNDAEKAFVPFLQGSKDKRGIGLGLSIARRSVEAIKGCLRIRNRPGDGCIFTIDLPRHLTRKGCA